MVTTKDALLAVKLYSLRNWRLFCWSACSLIIFYPQCHMLPSYISCMLLRFVVAISFRLCRYRLLSLRSDYIYQKLFINASECVLIVNKTGHIVSVNKKCCKRDFAGREFGRG